MDFSVMCVIIRFEVGGEALMAGKSSLLDKIMGYLVRDENTRDTSELLYSCQSSTRLVCNLTVVIFEIANLASSDKYWTPGPVNSTILSEATVFLLSCCII